MGNSASDLSTRSPVEVEPRNAALARENVEDQSTRDKVVQSVMAEGPLTARQLSERLALTPAAIRRHLQALLAEGTLDSREERVYGPRGRGRPSRVFFLTDTGRAAFRQAYDELAIAAMRQLAAQMGPEAMRQLAQNRVDIIEQRFHAIREAHPEREPIDVLREALSEDGYAPSIRPVVTGDQLCQHHCPVAQVAAEFPILCQVETQLFSRLLDTHLQRIATIAHGDGVCTTHIPNPELAEKKVNS